MPRNTRLPVATLATACTLLAACASSATHTPAPDRTAGATSPATAAEQFFRAVLSTKHVPAPTCQHDENRSFHIQTVRTLGEPAIVRATKVLHTGSHWVVTIEFAPDGSSFTTVPVVKEHGRYYACP